MTTPYYHDAESGITIYHGDAREVDEWLAADVLITDPPYGISLRSSNWHDGEDFTIAGDHDTEARDKIIERWGDRPAAVFGSWKAPRPAGCRQRLIWDKSDGTGSGMGDLSLAFGNSEEEIYLLGRWPKRERRLPNVIRTADGIRLLAAKLCHPTPKPQSLMACLIANAPDGVIADPFAGSGSTIVAAKLAGRRAVACELEERYCETIARRLEQGVLFGPESP